MTATLLDDDAPARPAQAAAETRCGNSPVEDFARDVWCLFGLPVDNLCYESACTLIDGHAAARRRALLSTININWIATSLTNPQFRASILNSDICTVDGVPLLWLARLAGLPMRDTVAGSTLIDRLCKRKAACPLTVFFMGGKERVAQEACRKVNRRRGGLRAVGHYNPGFGPLTAPPFCDGVRAVNTASPDLLVVALGALRGQSWIEQHRRTLDAGLVSHLGAAVDFLAGNERRAPRWLQRAGLEWLWRSYQRPALLHRYAADFFRLLKLLARHRLTPTPAQGTAAGGGTVVAEDATSIRIALHGSLTNHTRGALRETFVTALAMDKDIHLDFAAVGQVDRAFLGYLLLLIKHQARNRRKLLLINSDREIEKIFRRNLIDVSANALGVSYPSATLPVQEIG